MADNNGSVTMNMEDMDEANKYNVGDECKISAMGIVKSIDIMDTDTAVTTIYAGKENGKSTKKEKYMVRLELKDIETDNVSEEDDAEAAMSGMTTKQYKGVKKLKNEVKAKHEIV